MVAVIQRVTEASVKVEGKVVGEIGLGFLVLLGVATGDTENEADWIAKKISSLRLFSDEAGKMNLGLADVNGRVLLISQFTLLGNAKKGNRPSFIKAAHPDIAILLYEKVAKNLELLLNRKTEKGVFGADMKVSLLNDGPVTFVLNTETD